MRAGVDCIFQNFGPTAGIFLLSEANIHGTKPTREVTVCLLLGCHISPDSFMHWPIKDFFFFLIYANK